MIEYVLLLVLLLAALYLFWTQAVRAELTAMLVMLALILPWPHDGEWRGILTYQQGFSGFGSAAVIMIASMFVIGAAIVQTGAAEALGLRLLRQVADREWLLQMTVLATAAACSMIINDTTVVVILLPLVLSLCRERNLAPSRYLLLVAYGSLLGGQWTLIGTRSNIILSDFLRLRTNAGIGFFDFTPTAAAIFAVAAVFIFFVGRHWLPAVKLHDGPREVTEFLTELIVPEGSGAIGRRVREIEHFQEMQLRLIALVRNDRRLPMATMLQAGDMLFIRGDTDQIRKFVQSADFSVQEEPKLDREALEKVDLVTVEAIVSPASYFAGITLDQLALSERFGVTVLGMERRGQHLPGRLMDTRLAYGDALLLLGSADDIRRLGQTRDLIFLEERTFPPIGKVKASIVLSLLAGVVLLSITGLLSPAISIPLAAVLTVLFGCITIRAAYASIDLPTLVILGGMIPYGLALEETGAAEAIATIAVNGLSGFPPIVLLGALLLIALMLTQIIENAAVAIIIAPIAYQVAQSADIDAKALMIPLAICISAGFTTPVAHESTILVMGPGHYQFKHYLMLGGALAIVTWFVTLMVTPLIWPLTM